MGRHSEHSSVSSTLNGIAALARGKGSARRRADGPAQTPLTPMVMRAGGAAASLALAVSGGAYAAVNVSDNSDRSTQEGITELAAIGAPSQASDAETAAAGQTFTVAGATETVTTVTEDTETDFQRVEEQTDSLKAGKTEVKTQGVKGVNRTTYQVVTVDGVEVSRQAISTVEVTKAVDEVVQVGTGTAATAAAAASASGAATAALAAAGTDAASAQAVARSMLSSYGWGDDQFSCLVSLWQKESNWNYLAQNASSGAYGIPQALPGSKMASAGADWQTNPATQISWGLGYISGRYGSPCGAWAHSQSVGWY